MAEDWQAHPATIRQPAILFPATGEYESLGAPPSMSAEQAPATIERLADCHVGKRARGVGEIPVFRRT